MIVLDAGLLIAHLDADDVHHLATRGFLEEFEEFDFGANVLSIAEAIVHPTRSGRALEVLDALVQLELIRLETPGAAAAAIAEARASTGLGMPDVVVLNSAELIGAELATTDRRLFAAAQSRGTSAHLVG